MIETNSHVDPSLLVGVINGPGGSGKSTLVAEIGQQRDDVATDSTGVDYRLLGSTLVNEGVIETGMPQGEVSLRIEAFGVQDMVEILAEKAERIEKLGGLGFISSQEASEAASIVGAVPSVRNIIRQGLKKRIEAVRDEGEHRIMLIEGRNLAPVAHAVEGASVVMKNFVYCNSVEAAWRETEGAGLDITSPEGEIYFNSALAALRERNQRDRLRDIDPVRLEKNDRAYDYWLNKWLPNDTVKLMVDRGADVEALGLIGAGLLGSADRHLPELICDEYAAGDAAEEQVELFFDTSPFRQLPDSVQAKKAMIETGVKILDQSLLDVLVH